ncbi:ribonuclease H-like domain-containing protein [Exiguobacterium flavidum]|uniref:ribonuclease H-like domain-containing protein n=1 Tax=Exiguobacterium flavidum TaxID=2184695 RepID=UPI000DF7C906|nr:ribonuclease H-like domain-containing protein [Exiguobacterium flavidum]
MKNKLRRMLGATGGTNEKTIQPERQEEWTEEQAAWRDRGAEILTFEEEWIVRIDKRFELEERHGKRSFKEAHDSLQLPHPPLGLDVPLDRIIFFDTETTGLKGAGTTIFLLGFARFEGDSLLLRQYFLPHPHFEAAFYHHFLEDIGDEVKFVTYNGKSFDWPQVKTRHVFVRDRVPKLPKAGHLDLLHVCRRMFRGQEDSFRLGRMEERIGHEREDDLPGFLAPMHYFQYVEHQKPEIMDGVLKHHATDCLTLVSLYDECNRLVTHREEALPAVRENIAVWLADLKIDDQSVSHFERASELSESGWFRQGLLNKRLKKHEEAAACFKKSGGFLSYIELAKYAEHIAKDPELAYDYTEQARQLLERGHLLASRKERLLQQLDHRSNRLKRKCRS